MLFVECCLSFVVRCFGLVCFVSCCRFAVWCLFGFACCLRMVVRCLFVVGVGWLLFGVCFVAFVC